MFGQYYDRSKYEEKSSIGKLAGFGFWAGITVLAGTTASRTGAFKSLSKPLFDHLSESGIGRASKLASEGTQISRGSIGSAVNQLLSSEAHGYTHSLRDFVESSLSERLGQARTSTFVSKLRENVHQDSMEAFDKIVPTLRSRLNEPLQKTDLVDAQEVLMGSQFLDDLGEITRGINFTTDSRTELQKTIGRAAKSAYSEKVRRKIIVDMMADEDNRTVVMKMINKGINERKKTYNLFDSITPDNYKEITVGELFDQDGNISQLGRKIDREVQRTVGLKEDESFVQELMNRHQEGFREAFGDHTKDKSLGAVSEHTRALMNEFTQGFMNSKTGFVMDETGNMVAKAYIGKIATQRGKEFLDDFSLPLLPGVFKVNVGKMFSFLKEDNRFIRNLGRGLAQPELRRHGVEIGESDSLIGIGRGVLKYDVEAKKFTELSGEFRMIPKRQSRQAAEMARIRSMEPEDVWTRTNRVLNESTAMKKIRAGMAPDPDDLSLLKKQIFDKQHIFMEPHIGPGGTIVMTPTSEGLKMGIDQAAIRKIFPDATNVRATDLNPDNLLKLQDLDVVRNSPGLGSEIAMLLGKQSATVPENIGGFLDQASRGLNANDLTIGGKDVVPSWVLDLARKADDPAELLAEMERLELFTPGVREELKRFPALFQSIELAQVDREAFFNVGKKEGNFWGNLLQGFFGEDNPTKPVLDLQESLLEQLQTAYGVRRMQEIGVTEQSLRNLNDQLKGTRPFAQIDDPLTNALADALGLDRNSREFAGMMREMVGGMFEADDMGNLLLDTGGVNRVASFLGAGVDDLKHLGAYNTTVGSKIAYNQMRGYRSLQHARLNQLPAGYDDLELDNVYQTMYDRIRDISKSETMKEGLTERFKYRNFEPYRSDLTPGRGSDYYVLTSTFNSTEAFSDPVNWIKNNYFTEGQSIIDRIVQGTSGYFDPNSALGMGNYFTTVLGQMSNQLAIDAGLGLSVQDKMTLARTFTSYAAKRVAPVVLGLELYKNINADANNIGMPGLDDVGAHTIAHMNILGAGFKDLTGLTQLNKWIVSSVPGLDQYFSPRSKEEYEEYLLYGDEAVRNGRGWVIGNRNAMMGAEVDYYRPNFYRRWKSGWTEADNVDLSNPNYSFLPTLSNPLAPLNRLINPGWWEEKHKYDRPYKPNGLGSGFGTRHSVMGAAYGFELDGGGGLNIGVPTGRGGDGFGYGPDGSAEGGTMLYMSGFNPMNAMGEFTDRFRAQSGLYGSMFKMIPFLPSSPTLPVQHAGQARDFRRYLFGNDYGELLGPSGEFFRRLIGFPTSYEGAYSPYRNNMPSWLPSKFHSGDPYMRVKGPGELQLPGEAFELTHQWVRPLKVRGSMIGMSENEIIQKWLDPMDFTDSPYLEYGSWAHKEVQRQLDQQGILMAAEVPIYDPENNLSGTIDAVVRGPHGPTVVEIKTQNAEDFLKQHNPQKYIEQLNFYLNTTQTQIGYLAFVNSENPEQVRIVPVQHDEERFARTMEKIGRARDRVTQMVENREISPYETYDILSRLEVLGKVAPESREFKELVEFAEGGGFNANEKLIFDRIKSQANEKTKTHRTYSYRDPATKTMVGKVLAVNPDGSITTSKGTIRLAGLEFDEQSFIKTDAVDLMGQYGIVVGRPLMFTVNKGLNPDVMRDSVSAARIGTINSRLVEDGIANYMANPEDPMDWKSKDNRGMFRNTIEWIMHRDNIISNKFFRVRSPIEQYERGEVYGTDFASWSEPFDTMLKPTLAAMISKDPFTAGIQSGIITSFFFRKRSSMLKYGTRVGALFSLLSTVRVAGELVTGKKWIREDVRKQNEIDEYYDALEYVKQISIAERAKQDAYIYEGLNLETDTQTKSQYRDIMQRAEDRAKSTLFAFDVAKGTLDEAIEAMPFRNQQIAREIAMYGSLKDKRRFYELLPDSQKRVMGKFLGQGKGELPRAKDLNQMFGKYNLPNSDWTGWDIDSDLSLYSAGTSEILDTNVVGISKKQKAELALDKRIRIPRMDNPGFKNISKRVEKLASEINLPIQVQTEIIPASEMSADVHFDISYDRSAIIEESLRKDSRRG